MKLVKVFIVAAVFSVINLAAGVARAAPGVEPGWYVGADVGRSELKFDGGADSSDTAFAVHGGYRFGRYFAVEASYADLGSFGYTLDCPPGLACVPELFPQQTDVSARRLDLALLGIVPFGDRWEAHAKLGYARTKFDTTVRVGQFGISDFSDDNSDLIYGVGLRFHFDPPWSLRLQWERIPDINDSNEDLDALWLGAEYRFGG